MIGSVLATVGACVVIGVAALLGAKLRAWDWLFVQRPRLYALALSAAGAGFGLAVATLGLIAALLDGHRGLLLLGSQALGTLGAEVAVVLFFGLRVRGAPGWAWGAAIGAVPLFLGLSALWELAVSSVAGPRVQAVVGVLITSEGWARIGLVVGIAVVAPFLEELLFRGAWFGRLLPLLGERQTVALTGIAFGAIHLSDPWAVPPLVAMGLGLGWLRAKSGSVWPGVLAHALNNSVAVVVALGDSW